jgi:hypothetical protein
MPDPGFMSYESVLRAKGTRFSGILDDDLGKIDCRAFPVECTWLLEWTLQSVVPCRIPLMMWQI